MYKLTWYELGALLILSLVLLCPPIASAGHDRFPDLPRGSEVVVGLRIDMPAGQRSAIFENGRRVILNEHYGERASVNRRCQLWKRQNYRGGVSVPAGFVFQVAGPETFRGDTPDAHGVGFNLSEVSHLTCQRGIGEPNADQPLSIEEFLMVMGSFVVEVIVPRGS